MRQVLILLASQSNLNITGLGQEILRSFKIPFELRIASAERSPRFVEELVHGFEAQGGKVILCVAAESAHLAAVVAAMSNLPVLAIPLPESASSELRPMPREIPWATMSFGESGFTNAALFACQIIASSQPTLYKELQWYRQSQSAEVLEADTENRVFFNV